MKMIKATKKNEPLKDAQRKCPYCEGEVWSSYWYSVSSTLNSIGRSWGKKYGARILKYKGRFVIGVDTREDGVWGGGEALVSINYCPKCGRKLGR